MISKPFLKAPKVLANPILANMNILGLYSTYEKFHCENDLT